MQPGDKRGETLEIRGARLIAYNSNPEALKSMISRACRLRTAGAAIPAGGSRRLTGPGTPRRIVPAASRREAGRHDAAVGVRGTRGISLMAPKA